MFDKKVSYNVDQTGDTSDVEKTRARYNVGAAEDGYTAEWTTNVTYRGELVVEEDDERGTYIGMSGLRNMNPSTPDPRNVRVHYLIPPTSNVEDGQVVGLVNGKVAWMPVPTPTQNTYYKGVMNVEIRGSVTDTTKIIGSTYNHDSVTGKNNTVTVSYFEPSGHTCPNRPYIDYDSNDRAKIRIPNALQSLQSRVLAHVSAFLNSVSGYYRTDLCEWGEDDTAQLIAGALSRTFYLGDGDIILSNGVRLVNSPGTVSTSYRVEINIEYLYMEESA